VCSTQRLIEARHGNNSSVVLAYSLVLACYCASDEQTLSYAPETNVLWGCLTASERGKGVVLAHEGLVPQERSLISGSTQWFKIIRTTRTNNMQSGEKCISFWAFDSTGNIRAIPCKRWSCKICQKRNAQLWAWRAELHVENDPYQFYMWTLTLGSSYKDVRKAYGDLKKLWDRLRKAVVRYYQKKYNWKYFTWTYLAFVEGQPKRNGMPHFHILSAISAPERIKDFAVRCGFGFQADEHEINGKGAGAYVAKYASKGAGIIPKDFRRVRASQDWAKLPDIDKDTLFVKSKTETLTAYFLRVHEATGVSIDSLWLN
jgi:hypothetical protein